MFTQLSIPSDRILTRYIAPFGLTALLRPSKAGQPVESFWVGSGDECGIVLFVSALDAEIYRLHARTIGAIGFQHTVEHLGQAWTHLVFAFNANASQQLTLDPSGCFLSPYFPDRFGPLDVPSEPVTFRFRTRLFEAMEDHWTCMGEPDYAQTINKLNRLGAADLRELAERALSAASLGPVGEPRHEQTDWAVFSPDANAWHLGPNQPRQGSLH